MSQSENKLGIFSLNSFDKATGCTLWQFKYLESWIMLRALSFTDISLIKGNFKTVMKTKNEEYWSVRDELRYFTSILHFKVHFQAQFTFFAFLKKSKHFTSFLALTKLFFYFLQFKEISIKTRHIKYILYAKALCKHFQRHFFPPSSSLKAPFNYFWT